MLSARPSVFRMLPALVVAVVVFAACGGDEGGGGGNAGGGGGGGGGGGDITVSAVDNAFEPSTLEVPSDGQVTVEVTNEGQNPHTFSSEEGGFDSGTLNAGDSKTVTFDAPGGEIQFICNIHGEAMSGTIVPQG